ncbi:MAG: L-2-amino-thiazoline-4-carboxylic acid hydrolase [Desulfobacteraceae bacterium]|nr:L-2-amino-thiazoline-4-carboxylic acid hydrolase [Desulfobacteraceae bacterium]
MEQQSENIQFTAHHHALFFACVTKSVIKETGEEKGGTLIRKAVRKYGEQRGKRMALRVKKYGHDLTMDNYLAFGEWEVPKQDMDFKLAERNPHARLIVHKCPWYETWEKNNLLDFGQYFCKEIDAALVRGFNPSLVLEVNSTQTNDKKPCDFLFMDAGLSFFKMLGLVYKKKIRPGRKVIMPWEYHTGHLYKTMGEVIRQEFGDKADEIMENALNDFATYFNKKCIEVIRKYKNTDFEQIP